MRFGRVLMGLAVIVVAGCATFLVWAWRSEIAAIEPPAPSAFDPALVQKGAELAAIGNCAACHTSPGGQPYAGGRGLPTPFGTIYSTNITPDPATGLGRWSEVAFRRAMHEGVDRFGRHLYPAFPYDHFTLMTDGDVRALYAFVMTRQPIAAEAHPNELPFPLNFRLSVAAWKLLFFQRGGGGALAQDSEWNRGRYLAEAVAHCGACHRPRNKLGAESANATFDGGQTEGWDAPPLDPFSSFPMSADELAAFLRNERTSSHRAAAGPMAAVTANLAHAAGQDLKAIATYITSFTGGAAASNRRTPPRTSTQGSAPARVEQTKVAAPPGMGAEIYAGACAVCHESSRRIGLARGADLAVSTAVQASRPRNFIQFVLAGVQPPAGQSGAFMPSFSAALTDEQLSALAAYVRGRFSQNPAWQDVGGEIAQVRRGDGT